MQDPFPTPTLSVAVLLVPGASCHCLPARLPLLAGIDLPVPACLAIAGIESAADIDVRLETYKISIRVPGKYRLVCGSWLLPVACLVRKPTSAAAARGLPSAAAMPAGQAAPDPLIVPDPLLGGLALPPRCLGTPAASTCRL